MRPSSRYAVVEGVSFGLLDGWLGLAPEKRGMRALSLIGGGARSGWWAQLLASLLGVTMVVHEHGAARGAIGAARLAWLADGGDEAEVCRVPSASAEFVADSSEASLLRPRHDRFRALYPALRDRFSAGDADAEEAAAGIVAVAEDR